MNLTEQELPTPGLESYAASHCRQCAAGWVRVKKDGGILIVCLLDREPVLAGMADCNRFEPKAPLL